jgi:hypothetical protein
MAARVVRLFGLLDDGRGGVCGSFQSLKRQPMAQNQGGKFQRQHHFYTLKGINSENSSIFAPNQV